MEVNWLMLPEVQRLKCTKKTAMLAMEGFIDGNEKVNIAIAGVK